MAITCETDLVEKLTKNLDFVLQNHEFLAILGNRCQIIHFSRRKIQS